MRFGERSKGAGGPLPGRWRARRGRLPAALAAGLAIVGAAAAPAGADPAPAPGPEDARALVRLLGADGDLEALSRTALTALDRAHAPAADRARLAALVAEAFDPARLRARVVQGVLADWDAERAAEARGWLRTSAARAVLDRGRRASRDAAGRCAAGPAARRTDPERDALLRRVAAHAADPGRAERRAREVRASLLRGANAALPPERRLPAEGPGGSAGDAPAPGASDLEVLRCQFRDVGTPQLARADAFFTSPAGRWAVETVEAALDDALRGAARALGRAVVERFAPPPAAPWRAARRGAGAAERPASSERPAS